MKDMDDIIRAVAEEFDIPEKAVLDVKGKSGSAVRPRQIAIYLAREMLGLPHTMIADLVGRHNVTVGQNIRRIEDLITRHDLVARKVTRIRDRLAKIPGDTDHRRIWRGRLPEGGAVDLLVSAGGAWSLRSKGSVIATGRGWEGGDWQVSGADTPPRTDTSPRPDKAARPARPDRNRQCLKCRRSFPSSGPGHRLCNACRQLNSSINRQHEGLAS